MSIVQFKLSDLILEKYLHILEHLDNDTRQKALTIANQLVIRENLADDRAIRIAIALAKSAHQFSKKSIF